MVRRSTSEPTVSETDEHVIARIVADAPPLTESTRARLAALLRPSTSGGDSVVESLRATIRGAA